MEKTDFLSKPPGKKISRARMNVLKDSAILSLNEFSRLRSNAMSPVDRYCTYKSVDATNKLSNPNAQAEDHKKRIIEYDKTHNTQSYLYRVEKKKDEDPYLKVGKNDHIVKEFDKLCKFAKIATIRDRQVSERKVMEKMYKDKEAKLDLMMELERLKEIRFMNEREDELKKQRKIGALTIIDQIHDNEVERRKKKEQIEKERLLMIKQLEKMKKEDELVLQQKKEHQKMMHAQEVKENEMAIVRKQLKKIDEQKEDLEIEKFNRDKALQEEAIIKEKKLLAQKKEMELQKLRSMQERAIDKQAILDAARAKRAYEESVLKDRKEAQEQLEKKQKLLEDIIKQNDMQLQIKKEMKAQEAEKQQAEFLKLLAEQNKAQENDRRKQEEREEVCKQYRVDLEKQIQELEEKSKLGRFDKENEGRLIKDEYNEYNNNLERIRQLKIKELTDLNIDEKYINPIRRYKLKTSIS